MGTLIGDVVLIKVEENEKGKWNIRILEDLNKRKDDVIKTVMLRSKKTRDH